VPGIYYGQGSEAVPIRVEARDFNRRIANLEGAHLIQTASQVSELNGKMVLVRELQTHPVSGQTLHFDLLQVPLDQELEVKVALHFDGKSAGVALGGILQPLIRELSCRCLPTGIPDSISVDITKLEVGDSLHVEDLVLPSGVRAVPEDNPPVVTVMPPVVDRRDEEAAAGEGEAGDAAAPAGDAPAES
jgi:large subunit ribosomal protein L25